MVERKGAGLRIKIGMQGQGAKQVTYEGKMASNSRHSGWFFNYF